MSDLGVVMVIMVVMVLEENLTRSLQEEHFWLVQLSWLGRKGVGDYKTHILTQGKATLGRRSSACCISLVPEIRVGSRGGKETTWGLPKISPV